MRKDEVEFHSDGFGEGRPAVNVKVDVPYVYGTAFERLLETVRSNDGLDDRFTVGWVEDHEQETQWAFEAACEDGWEDLQADAEDIFGKGATVGAEGRSGGWAVVDGLPDFDSWDAIDLGKWARFAKVARLVADDVPYRMLSLIGLNTFEAWRVEQDKRLTGPTLAAVL